MNNRYFEYQVDRLRNASILGPKELETLEYVGQLVAEVRCKFEPTNTEHMVDVLKRVELDRQQPALAEDLVASVKDLLTLVDMLMPGLKHIAIQDYALLNESQIRARQLIGAKS